VNSVQNPAQHPGYVTGLEARFAAAARHSRMVRILRVAVPAVVGLSMASIIFISVYNPFHDVIPKLPLEMDNLVVSGTKITMESPHLAGFSTDGRPYEMWAKAAIQDITDPDHVELKTIRAKVAQQDQSTVTMDIFLQSSTGYEARLSQAFVDINKGNVSSDEHVDVKLLDGTLTADRLRIYNSGELVRFEGNVVMHLDKLGDNNASPPADPAPPPPPPKARKSANTK
jgi:lipopolysaccharide export system protein LptC